jgi:predicted aspartyl protease
MGTFHVNCSVQDITGEGNAIIVPNLLVDSGSEYTWLPQENLADAGITIRKRDLPFVMANGQIVTRDVGYAILRCQEFETVDEVVFAKEGDLRLLDARTLEGFGAVLDARQKRLVAAGPYPAARSTYKQ